MLRRRSVRFLFQPPLSTFAGSVNLSINPSAPRAVAVSSRQSRNSEESSKLTSRMSVMMKRSSTITTAQSKPALIAVQQIKKNKVKRLLSMSLLFIGFFCGVFICFVCMFLALNKPKNSGVEAKII